MKNVVEGPLLQSPGNRMVLADDGPAWKLQEATSKASSPEEQQLNMASAA